MVTPDQAQVRVLLNLLILKQEQRLIIELVGWFQSQFPCTADLSEDIVFFELFLLLSFKPAYLVPIFQGVPEMSPPYKIKFFSEVQWVQESLMARFGLAVGLSVHYSGLVLLRSEMLEATRATPSGA